VETYGWSYKHTHLTLELYEGKKSASCSEQFIPGKEPPEFIRDDTGWAPDSVWM